MTANESGRAGWCGLVKTMWWRLVLTILICLPFHQINAKPVIAFYLSSTLDVNPDDERYLEIKNRVAEELLSEFQNDGTVSLLIVTKEEIGSKQPLPTIARHVISRDEAGPNVLNKFLQDTNVKNYVAGHNVAYFAFAVVRGQQEKVGWPIEWAVVGPLDSKIEISRANSLVYVPNDETDFADTAARLSYAIAQKIPAMWKTQLIYDYCFEVVGSNISPSELLLAGELAELVGPSLAKIVDPYKIQWSSSDKCTLSRDADQKRREDINRKLRPELVIDGLIAKDTLESGLLSLRVFKPMPPGPKSPPQYTVDLPVTKIDVNTRNLVVEHLLKNWNTIREQLDGSHF